MKKQMGSYIKAIGIVKCQVPPPEEQNKDAHSVAKIYFKLANLSVSLIMLYMCFQIVILA